ncbi:putative Histone acetyltransferase [Gigaspora margarita]|uniref:Histone acetyltransferase n=1 Tax=Gigaspora margarita TaxID=4874 RepID=A0A8H4AW83_GIGMA|nr:putative Histone acetyltransferase [Gigaspora margarita]
MIMSSITVEKVSLTNGISTPNKSKRKSNRTPASEDVQENATIIQLGSRSKTKRSKHKDMNNSSASVMRVKSRVFKQRSLVNRANGTSRNRRKISRMVVSDTESTNSDTTPDVRKDERVESSSDSSHEFDRNDENKINFALKLTPEEADTSKTRPDHHDKVMFENAKFKAEEVKEPREKTVIDPEDQHQAFATSDPTLKAIRFGEWEIEPWCASSYEMEYIANSLVYVCEFCLKYMRSEFIADRHKMKCPLRHPPGDEIYRDGPISIFEVDGRKNKIYCQNLCLFAKMFIAHKTLFFDVEPFLFYVMTEANDTGCHFVGYFSKEKRSQGNHNVSCILILPIHQRKGYGNLLIEFSYLLTKRENKIGSPEKPLSKSGLHSYRYYWKNVLFEELNNDIKSISVQELSRLTSMTVDDVIATLQINNMIEKDEINDTYKIIVSKKVVEDHLRKVEAKGYPRIKPESLRWTPFILTRVLNLTPLCDDLNFVIR